MPTYVYECERCGSEFEQLLRIAERRNAKCSCGGRGKQIIKHGVGFGTRSFRPYLEKNADFDPHWIETPQQLRNLCDKRNCYHERIEDGLFRTSPGPDPDADAPGVFGNGAHGNHRDPISRW